ncbi:MAG: lysophospholipid acyltransferase family protein [Patescibacteria group bacterium]
MKERIKRFLELVAITLVIYPFGVILTAAFLLLRRLKYIKVLHWERFPHFKEKIILVANHPSMLDPFLAVALFFKGYLLNPLKYGPLVVSDKKNFWDSWYWFWLRPFLIPVDRGNKRDEAVSFLRIKKALEAGRVIIIFPEGGRTFCGDRFLHSESGKKIRTLKGGVALLVRKTNASVVPVWFEGTDKVLPNSRTKLFTKFRFRKKTLILIKIGESLRFQTEEREEITQVIASALLYLADEPF